MVNFLNLGFLQIYNVEVDKFMEFLVYGYREWEGRAIWPQSIFISKGIVPLNLPDFIFVAFL